MDKLLFNSDGERGDLIKKLFIFFAGIYFIQGLCQGGISGLFSLPLSFMLKDKLGFDQAQLAYFRGLVLIPWAIKPLYGVLSDFVPILGYRRKSWYIIVALLGIGSALYLAQYDDYTANQLLFTLSILAVSFAFVDVLCDAVMVENGKPLGLTDKFQGVQWASIALAAVLAGLGGGIIAEYFSYSQIFWAMAIPSFLVLVIAIFFAPERRYQYRALKKSESASIIDFQDIVWTAATVAIVLLILLSTNVHSLLKMGIGEFILFLLPFSILGSLCFLFRKVIDRMTFFCIGFLFWWNFSIGLNVAPFFYYQTHTLGFSKIFMGELQTMGSIGGLLGALLFLVISRRRVFWKGRFIAETNLITMLKWAGFISVIFIVSNFLLMGVKSAIILSVTMLFLSQFSSLVMLVLAAEFCPSKIEGTFFALLMSVVNLGVSMSERVSGILFNVFKSFAPHDLSGNYWARFLVWLGWPIQHADPKTPYDIFVQYYAIGWLIIISLGAFLLYFVLITLFGNSIKEKEVLKILDVHSLILDCKKGLLLFNNKIRKILG